MKYLDSNVFIYPVVASEKTERKASLAKNLLLQVARGNLKVATSSLTWDELVWCVRRIAGVEIAAKEGERFLEFPNLRIIPVDEKILQISQRVVSRYGAKPRDAIHAGCAISNNIKEIISDDSDFDKIAEIKRVKLDEAHSKQQRS